MKRGRCWLKRVGIGATLFAVLLAAGCAYAWHRMNQADEQHAAFCQCGTSIKGFLSRYASALQQAEATDDVSLLKPFYAEDYLAAQRGHWQLDSSKDLGGVTLTHLVSHGDKTLDRQAVLGDVQRYLDGIAHIDHVKYKINLIEAIELQVSAVVTVKCVLDGQDYEGQLFQDRFFFRWHLENRGSSSTDDWQIIRDELVEGVRVAGRAQGFQRPTSSDIGIDYVHKRDPRLNKNDPNVRLKFAVIEHAAGGVSAVDFDDDGKTDLFFADGVSSRLYRNVTASGSYRVDFEDVTSRCGLDNIDHACSALFGDFDNDGDKDLFVSRYADRCLLFHNDGTGRFTDVTSQVRLDLTAPCVSACLLDYNLDGYLDIYVGVNGNAFNAAPDIPFYATNGQPDHLLRNVGGKYFVDVTERAGTGNRGWTLAVTSGDYNLDGYPDIAVANDFGRKVLYHNHGDGTFTDMAKQAGVLDFSGGMGVAFTDLNGDDAPDLLTSNIESGQRYFGEEITLWQFMRNELRSGWIWNDLAEYRELYSLLGDQWRELGKQVGEGNSVFCNQGDGTFVEWKDCHATRAGWAWSVNPLDFDNDTDMDIYVANGWISGKLEDDL